MDATPREALASVLSQMFTPSELHDLRIGISANPTADYFNPWRDLLAATNAAIGEAYPTDIKATLGSCDETIGYKDKRGYSRLSGRLAHRVVWERNHGAIPAGLVVDHVCRNPACTNVDHLRLLARAVNAGVRANRTRNGRCKNGHLFTPENTRIARPHGKNPYRVCVACVKKSRARTRERSQTASVITDRGN